jgi:hypothetical protein
MIPLDLEQVCVLAGGQGGSVMSIQGGDDPR